MMEGTSRSMSTNSSANESQLVEVSRALSSCENIQQSFTNVANSKKNYLVFNRCKEIHIGPKIDYIPPSMAIMSSQQIMKEEFEGCKERLKNYYKRRNAYMRSLFWDGKRSDLPIKKYFVELRLQKTDLFGEEKGGNVQLEDMFLKEYGNQTILVTGGPGYGKTTLCNKLAYDWSIDDQFGYLHHFDFVIVITLRKLFHKSVVDEILENIYGNSEVKPKSELRKANLNFLIILDGFDEIRDKNSVLKFLREESVNISLHMTILVTCRPHVSEDIREDMDVRFSVEGFTPEHQQKYIGLMLKLDNDDIKSLVKKLEEIEFYSGLAECPLMLNLLCCSYRNETLQDINKMTDLYVQIISLLIKRYVRKTGECHFLKQGKYFLGENLLIKLGNIVIYCDKESTQITSKILKKCFSEEEEYNFILGLDILKPYSFLDDDDDIIFDFVHRTFQEFLSALFLYEILKETIIFDRYSNNVILFLLGIAGDEPYPDNLLQFFGKKVFSPRLMMQARIEVKNEDNWKSFYSVTKILFCLGQLSNLKKLYSHYRFPRIYLCLPENQNDYQKMKDEIVEFHECYSSENKLEIYLFMHKSMPFIVLGYFPIELGFHNYRDIRQSVTTVVDLLSNVVLNKFNIYFCGISDTDGRQVLHTRGGNFSFFRSVENPILLSESVKEDISIKENVQFAALKVIDVNRNRFLCKDGFAVTPQPVYINYLVSVDQYVILESHIKTFPPFHFPALHSETIDLLYTCHKNTFICQPEK